MTLMKEKAAAIQFWTGSF